MGYFRSQLGLKLFFSYLIVIIVGMVVIGITSRFTTPRAFERHMMPFRGQFRIGPMMGQNLSGFENGMMSDLYRSFSASFNESLIWAVLAAACVAVLISYLFSRRIVAPLRDIMSATQRIAAGHYEERVDATGTDEIGQLARRFNLMAQQLEHVEDMRRKLIGDVAHELRTPLTAIQGSMEGLMDGVLPASKESFDQIHAEAIRLSHLVDDLQELSRVEARAYELEIRQVEIETVIKTVVKRMTQEFERKSVGLKINLPAEATFVHADEDRAIQVLSNLVGNALQHTQKGGQVTISSTVEGQEIIISVRDSGIGIPSEHLPYIFDRFYRVDLSRSRTRGGSGIGLTIARHLVEAQGGRIWAESGGEGKGSVFSFTLPLGSES